MGRQIVAKNLVRDNNPTIMVLQETKLKEKKTLTAKNKIRKQAEYITIPSIWNQNSSGGLLTMWDPTKVSVVRIPFLSRRAISIRVINISDNKSFVLTNVYAPNNAIARAGFWENRMAPNNGSTKKNG